MNGMHGMLIAMGEHYSAINCASNGYVTFGSVGAMESEATAEAQFSAQKGASSSLALPPCPPSVHMDMHMHLRRRRARGHGNAHAHARDATGPLHGQARPSRSCSPT